MLLRDRVKRLMRPIAISQKFFKTVIPNVCWTTQNLCRLQSSRAEDDASKNIRPRYNPINIQMLSSELHRQIFKAESSTDNNVDQKTLENIISHLKSHDLWKAEASVLPEVNFQIPQLHNSNIGEHFHYIGTQLSVEYKDLLNRLVKCKLPPLPKSWTFQSGWIQYGSNGETMCVDFPEETALVFDVEVCVQEGNYPTLATAVSENHWYLWCSERLVQNHFSLSKTPSLSDLIPMETAYEQVKPPNGKDWLPRLIIGHNVAFDRTFIKEQYFMEQTKTCFLDTMSLHICISGLTGIQRAMSLANKKFNSKNGSDDFPNIPMGWSYISSLNNLADVYSLYCESHVLNKTEREIFVTGSLTDVKENFQKLATYCAQDTFATHQILKKLTPLFFERFPHPVTFFGLLSMSSAYLPVNQNWQRYLNEAQSTYEDLQKELKLSLVHLANDACSLLHNDLYKNDTWLWDFDWSTQNIKFRKEMLKKSKNKKQSVKKLENSESETPAVNKISEPATYDDLEDVDPTMDGEDVHLKQDPTLKHIHDTAMSLRKVRPFLPGYPAWYRELCDKKVSENKNWEPGPNLISSQMRCVPKLMRLTWDGFPLHYDVKHGWGYLVPSAKKIENIVDQNFPLRNFLNLYTDVKTCYPSSSDPNMDLLWNIVNNPNEKRSEEAKFWKAILGKRHETMKSANVSPPHYGIGPHDIGVNGCLFYRLPHKDGPHKRVGNPLSKDFVPKVEDGTLKTWGKEQADRALLLSKMISYWKNAHGRIVSQMVVFLNREELTSTVTQNEQYDENDSYGAILPRLVPAGTVTRRAVEPTWLTASNAYEDRVGSELKCMIQAPPGYHFVGADVDSQELWIAAIFGDSQFAKVHGCTAFGWMTLQGKKSSETDMHSRTAQSVGISRNQAKVLNYARIYGAGKTFAQRLLMQFNHRLTPEEAKLKVKKIYTETKGLRR